MALSNNFPANETEEEKIRFLIKALDIKDNFKDITLKTLKGGITNSVELLTTPSQKYVIRVDGNNTDKIIDRKREIENIQKIYFIHIYHIWNNGLAYSYQEGKTISVPMMSDPQISKQITIQLGQFHSKTIHEQHDNNIYKIINNFLNGLDPKWQGKDGKTVDIKSLNNILTSLQTEYSKEITNSKPVLCHNDLLAGNILWNGKTVSLLDYEYSDYTYPEFDIANHFFEWCGFECDLKRYPSIEQQKTFLTNYLRSLYGKEPDPKLVEEWRIRVEKLLRLSHLFWGTWAYFQSQNSTVTFPYYEYAKQRILLINHSFPLKEGDPLLSGPLVKLD